MNSKNSFTYVISSDERTNTGANQIFYDIEFGGFSGKNQNYNCEVLSFSINGRTTATPAETGYFMFMCENLHDDELYNNLLFQTHQVLFEHYHLYKYYPLLRFFLLYRLYLLFLQLAI